MMAAPRPNQRQVLGVIFAAAFGVFLGLSLLKFGNPPIMEKYTVAPTNVYEFVIGSPWPIAWAYWLLGLVAVIGLFVARWNGRSPRWLLFLPLLWLLWQMLCTACSVDARLSNPTLFHFIACLACFYLGYFCLSHVERMGCFWAGVLCGFVLVLAAGLEQHFGGLEATRRWFYAYVYTQAKEIPPEYLKKIASNRIFSTLFYPNALAGVLLLLLPPMLGLVWKVKSHFTNAALWFLAALIAVPALACLFWSGSKGGWLLMLILAVFWFFWMPFDRRCKAALIIIFLLFGGAGFAAKYAGFFKKGATSVVARFDYWRAALKISASHPLLGTGPGTFAIPYQEIKSPQAEMSRLVHNDYLEQACESGIPGFLAYTAFIVCLLSRTAPARKSGPEVPSPAETKQSSGASGSSPTDWLGFSVWLGLLGWALQALFEFDLYLPALSWPAFAFMGWLAGNPWRTTNAIDKP
jgi:O-antigen ligase